MHKYKSKKATHLQGIPGRGDINKDFKMIMFDMFKYMKDKNEIWDREKSKEN